MKIKRVLSLVLVGCMLFSIPVSAAEVNTEESEILLDNQIDYDFS